VISSLLITAILAQASAVDVGAPAVDQLYVLCGDAPLMEEVDGGFFVPLRRQQRNNCKLAACEAFAEPKLKDEPPREPSSPAVVLGVVSVAIILFGGGIVLGYMMPHMK